MITSIISTMTLLWPNWIISLLCKTRHGWKLKVIRSSALSRTCGLLSSNITRRLVTTQCRSQVAAVSKFESLIFSCSEITPRILMSTPTSKTVPHSRTQVSLSFSMTPSFLGPIGLDMIHPTCGAKLQTTWLFCAHPQALYWSTKASMALSKLSKPMLFSSVSERCLNKKTRSDQPAQLGPSSIA